MDNVDNFVYNLFFKVFQHFIDVEKNVCILIQFLLFRQALCKLLFFRFLYTKNPPSSEREDFIIAIKQKFLLPPAFHNRNQKF